MRMIWELDGTRVNSRVIERLWSDFLTVLIYWKSGKEHHVTTAAAKDLQNCLLIKHAYCEDPSESLDHVRPMAHRIKGMKEWQAAKICCCSSIFASAVLAPAWACALNANSRCLMQIDQLNQMGVYMIWAMSKPGKPQLRKTRSLHQIVCICVPVIKVEAFCKYPSNYWQQFKRFQMSWRSSPKQKLPFAALRSRELGVLMGSGKIAKYRQ